MFLAPGWPFIFLSIAGALLALISILHLEAARQLVPGFRPIVSPSGYRQRLLLGQVTGAALAATLVLVARMSGMHGLYLLLMILLALAVWMAVGLVLPRRPQVNAERERRSLRRATPGFVSYIRISLAGGEAAATLLEQFVATPEPQRAALQDAVRAALVLMRTERRRPFDALLRVARERDCRELVDVVEALAQAEERGTDPRPALKAQQAMLEAILRDELTRTLKRRNLGLIGLVALSVLFGLVVNILFVMVVGGLRSSGL